MATKHKYAIINVVIFIDCEDMSGVNSESTFTIQDFIKYYRTLSSYQYTKEEVLDAYYMLLKYAVTDQELEEFQRQQKNIKIKIYSKI